jgi:hypothetical protein
MIVTEYLRDGTLVKHYSDSGFLIEQVETGARYGEAVDIVPCPFAYVETDEREESEEEDMTETEEKARAFDILTGVSE